MRAAQQVVTIDDKTSLQVWITVKGYVPLDTCQKLCAQIAEDVKGKYKNIDSRAIDRPDI